MMWIQVPLLFLIMSSLRGTYSEPVDPCTNYTAINDTTLSVAYKASSEKDVTCLQYKALNWYRYNGTTDGRMTSTCPQDLQCGSKSHIWFNDTVPAVAEREIKKRICTHNGQSCCSTSNEMFTKNCTDFIVYKFIPSPNCTNYCYEAPEKSKTTVEAGMSRSETNTPSISTLREGSSLKSNTLSITAIGGASSSIGGSDPEHYMSTTASKGGRSGSERNTTSLRVLIVIAFSIVIWYIAIYP